MCKQTNHFHTCTILLIIVVIMCLLLITMLLKSSAVSNSLKERESVERSGRAEEKRNLLNLLQDRSNSYMYVHVHVYNKKKLSINIHYYKALKNTKKHTCTLV